MAIIAGFAGKPPSANTSFNDGEQSLPRRPGLIFPAILWLHIREFYEKPTAERKRKKAAAVKRHFKRVRSMQLPKKLY